MIKVITIYENCGACTDAPGRTWRTVELVLHVYRLRLEFDCSLEKQTVSALLDRS